MKNLDFKKNIPLDKTCLIEASAGTGKTFSIAEIFAKAILSRIPIEEILVVTFTDAATKELKTRIREKLLKKLKEDNIPEDKVLLETAILNIDQSAIFTMHSFCQKMLIENAFESKTAYGAELIKDTNDIIREITENFWRLNFVNIPNEELKLYGNLTFDDVFDLAKEFIKHHNIEIVNNELHDIDESKIQEILNDSKIWIEKLEDPIFEQEIKELFKETKHFNQNHNTKLDAGYKNILSTIKNLKEETSFKYFCSKDGILDCHKKDKKTNKLNLPPIQHPLFDFCSEFKQMLIDTENLKNNKIIDLYNKLNFYIKEEFQKIKEQRNILTFNDLLINLHTALLEKNGNNSLTNLIKKKFKLALVDEFQDTDVIQYEIFEHLFNDKHHGFFMIGDPKQSIYKFRNADIFSYLTAKKNVDIQYTLDTNYRSEETMVQAINDFFMIKNDGKDTFAFPEKDGNEGLIFTPVKSNSQKSSLIIKNETKPFLNIWLVKGNMLERNIALNIAKEIIELMHKSQKKEVYFDDKEPLTMGDIAILVDTHKQAKIIKQVFANYAIPAVIQNSMKIFDSYEAREFELWIKAIQEPKKYNLYPLFTTSLMNKKISEIHNLKDQECFKLSEAFMGFNKLWQKKGVFITFSAFFKKYNIKKEILKKKNGERILSNFEHLIELLHKNEIQEGLSITRSLIYLQNHIEDSEENDEYIQRLESDSNSVKIMTIHSSKGLEFPIVFCPFTWDKSIKKGEQKQKVFLFNEKVDGKYIKKIDFGADKKIKEENRLFARKETLSENIRLLYVALTRAKNRCYLSIGDDPKTAKSMFWYLFSEQNIDNVVKLSTKNQKEHLTEIKAFCTNRNIHLIEKPPIYELPIYTNLNEEKLELNAKTFSKEITNDWSIGSFSSLIKFHKQQHKPTGSGDGFFSLPKGKFFGNAIHTIFENYWTVGAEEFKMNYPKYLEQPLKTLNYFRPKDKIKRKERFELVKTMINNVLNTKLDKTRNIILNDIELKDAKTELDFFYKINTISPLLLKNIFANYADINIKSFSDKLGRLNFFLEKGFMNGQIDLVFRKDNQYFILDWKTNHLGSDNQDYSPNKILNNMKESYYILQYHIYCLALHLYLKTKLEKYDYDIHFGGAYYIYTRGIDDDKNGIYFDKPKRELIENLEKKLIQGVNNE